MSFQCTAEGYPAPIIVWWRGGLLVSELDDRVAVATNQSQHSTTSKLVIFGLNSDDAVNYSCMANSMFEGHSGNIASESAELSLECELVIE